MAVTHKIGHKLTGEHKYGNLYLPYNYPDAVLDRIPDIDLNEDIIIASYPKTGKSLFALNIYVASEYLCIAYQIGWAWLQVYITKQLEGNVL